jgi:hypothetical protein
MSPRTSAAWDRHLLAFHSLLYGWSLVIAWGAVIWAFGSSQAPPVQSGDTGEAPRRRHTLIGALGSGTRWPWLIVVGMLVGLADELHQAAVPHRIFRAEDVGLDAANTLVGAVIAGLPGRRHGD